MSSILSFSFTGLLACALLPIQLSVNSEILALSRRYLRILLPDFATCFLSYHHIDICGPPFYTSLPRKLL